MPEITLQQKKMFFETIKNMNFNWDDFTIVDSRELSYMLHWKEESKSYTFKVYYPRICRAGYISIQYRTGNETNVHEEHIELPNLQGKFGQWLHEISNQIEFNKLTKTKKVQFSNTINSISPKFELIYTEALIAEQRNLLEICGMGYRKAFEFLLIDYLLYKGYLKSIEDAKKIKTLSDFINFLKDETVIHRLLGYTAWVGNEFCHYFRKHETKEISDLKEMIQVIVEWIDIKEKLTQIEAQSENINSSFKK